MWLIVERAITQFFFFLPDYKKDETKKLLVYDEGTQAISRN